MSWKLIKSIQEDTDLRLILPFGLALQLGDVVSVDKNGSFALEGESGSVLGVPTNDPRRGKPVDIEQLSGDDTSCSFRAAGDASTLFPDLPKASAGLDITFGSASSWALAVTGRSLSSLEEVNKFREPILNAYRNNVWKADWALVTSIGNADRMTLLAARGTNTKVALSLGASVTASAALSAQLTSGVTIAATSQQITQCVTSRRMPVSCTALRVRDPWWRSPYVRDLAEAEAGRDVHEASDDEFWEDVDVA
jgi:hypothetical protein